MFQRRRFHREGIADYPFAFAMQHNTEPGHVYSAQELRNCITEIEKVYNVKYDWPALFKAAEDMNEQNRIEIEKGYSRNTVLRPRWYFRDAVQASRVGYGQRS